MKICLPSNQVTLEDYSKLVNAGWSTRRLLIENDDVFIATKREQQYEYFL